LALVRVVAVPGLLPLVKLVAVPGLLDLVKLVTPFSIATVDYI